MGQSDTGEMREPAVSVAGAQTARLGFDPQRLVKVVMLLWVAIGVTLWLLDATIEYPKSIPHRSLRRIFNMAREDGIATWFSSLQAVLVALAAWLVRWRVKARDPDSRRAWGWTFLSGFFLYVAIDDGAKIHERVGTALRDMADGGGPFAVFPSYAWQVVFMPVFAIAALLIVWVWIKELRTARTRLLIAAGLSCYVLAVGLDFLEGVEGLSASIAGSLGVEAYTVRHFSKSCEELIEMLGTTMFLGGFLEHFLGLTARVVMVRQEHAG